MRICSFIRGPAGSAGRGVAVERGDCLSPSSRRNGDVKPARITGPDLQTTNQRHPTGQERILNSLHLTRRSRVVNGGLGYFTMPEWRLIIESWDTKRRFFNRQSQIGNRKSPRVLWFGVNDSAPTREYAAMRFIIANEFYQQMLQMPYHTPDCYVRPGEYLHHMYIDGVKYAIAPAVLDCLAQAEAKRGRRKRSATCGCTSCTSRRCSPTPSAPATSKSVTLLGDPPPTDEEADAVDREHHYAPRVPTRWEDLGPRSAVPLRPDAANDLHPRADDRRRTRERDGHPVRRPQPGLPGDAEADR